MKKYQFDKNTMEFLENLRAPLAVYQFIDRRVVTLVLSAGFCDLYEFTTREAAYDVMNRDMYSTVHPHDASRVADTAYRFATEGGKYEVVYRVKPQNNDAYKLVHAMGEHVYTSTGERLAYVWYTDEGTYTEKDDAEKIALSKSFFQALREESMIHVTYFDELTGLPNMFNFYELAEIGRKNLRQQGRQPAFLFVDLSGMKFFNRKYGFAEGDKLLLAVSKILVRHFSNESCSRFGQDHFAVITEAEGLEAELRMIFEECSCVNEGKNVPIRVGIYLDRMDEVNVSTACDRAKCACDDFRNTYVSGYLFFDDKMLQQSEKKQYIIDNLDRAIEEKWIKVYYQPIIRTANGKVCDEEALSRWIDPVRGFLSPGDFIPVLEDARLIYKLDLYVVDQILEKIKNHEKAGLYIVPQSVNLSRVDFDTCDIVEEICRRVDAAGISREKLTIEITESVIGKDFMFIKEQVERFRSQGFQVWMDDFGSGYSSLDVLQSIRFDLLKLDMLFMRRFEDGEEGKVILTELVKMAIGLGIDTICEGVETAEQAAFLREIGCTKLQGFYYCKPIPQEEIVERNRKGIQIGYENPEESDYYAALGKVNLYDFSSITSEDQDSRRHYFNTIPMAIIESRGDSFTLVRSNSTYRDFIHKVYEISGREPEGDYRESENIKDGGFVRALRQCAKDGKRTYIDEEMPDGSTIHTFIRPVAENPVTGTKAIAVAVLDVAKEKHSSFTAYSNIARALFSRFHSIFYVDPETGEYTEYRLDTEQNGMAVEKKAMDFFNEKQDPSRFPFIYEEDREYYRESFTKKKVMEAVEKEGCYTLSYRVILDGAPVYIRMKAFRLSDWDPHILVSVSRMKQKGGFEKTK